MINGIYQSATGLESLDKLQETIANNLANISTTGFKQQLVQVQRDPLGRLVAQTSLDMQSGPVQITNEPTHLAAGQDQLFEVTTPQGPAYTRNGNFGLDENGRLVAGGFWPVQGGAGDIVLPHGAFTVSGSGEIVVSGEVVDQIKLVRADRPLNPLSNGLMVPADGSTLPALAPGEGQVMQGALEGSNVNPLQSMVDLISVARLYEANQKAMQSQDETLKDAVTTIGRTA
jgi:flagellar basal-body rod protein FlgG